MPLQTLSAGELGQQLSSIVGCRGRPSGEPCAKPRLGGGRVGVVPVSLKINITRSVVWFVVRCGKRNACAERDRKHHVHEGVLATVSE